MCMQHQVLTIYTRKGRLSVYLPFPPPLPDNKSAEERMTFILIRARNSLGNTKIEIFGFVSIFATNGCLVSGKWD